MKERDDNDSIHPRPDGLVDWSELTLTSRCNQRCFFCYEDGRDIAREPALEDIQRLLRETAKQAALVVLCGKEVLLRPDVLDIVAYGASLGLRVAVFSNGQALARHGLVADLVQAGCSSLVVSFHFPDPDTFARGTRTLPKGFHRSLEGLSRVRDYNVANPASPIHLTTESDMFALNLGRLAHMRQTLQGALGDSPWSMRLGCLLPSPTHDIGLPDVLEPLAKRRDELDAFLRSHPEDLPLEFVKVPLCMLPRGHEHRSLDVKYIHQRILLTSNHEDAQAVTTDGFSTSVRRDLVEALREHPYRFLCRSCPLVPLCRFNRVDWHHAGFLPTVDQKPQPRTEVTAEEVLERLGPTAPETPLEQMQLALASMVFPEERILDALAHNSESASSGAPRFLQAHVDREPLLVLEFDHNHASVFLRLLPPPVQPLDRSLGAIVGCFHVVSDSDDAHVLASCATALAPSQMPPPEAWEKEPWFDPHRARLFQTVSRTFGPRLWPDSGTLGSWTCQSVSLSPRAEVVALMRHETGLEAHLSCGLPGQHASCPEPALTVDVCLLPGTADPPKSWGPVEDLQRTVAALVTGKTPAPTPASHAARLGLVFMRLTGDGWSVHPAELPAGQFRFQLSLAGAGIDMCMAAFQPERIGKRVGNVVIRVHGGGHGPEADSFAKAVIATAQALQSVPPCPASLTAWRTALGRILYRMPSPLKGTWRVTWEPETSPRNGL